MTGVDAQTLREVMGSTLPDGGYGRLIDGYNNAMRAAEITTVERAAMFAAQLGHESYGLRYMEEIADGSAYEGRRDLGNTQPGDGRRFKGRGPIQLTGRTNYRAFTRWVQSNGYTTLDFEREPHRLSEPHWGFLAAAYYWTVARPQINTLSDQKNLQAVTRAINGGLNGLSDREARYHRALKYGARLLPGGTVTEKVLDYPRGAVTQDTYYYCGPASCQTVIRSATGKLVAESILARKLGTHTGGTDYIGQFPAVLNEYMPAAKYKHRDIPNDPATKFQKEQLWRDLTGSIDAGYGVVANIVAPPSNYPRSVAPSTENLRYAGGTVYHYIAVMGYAGEGAGRRVWLADSGFYPYGAWIKFDQLATLIPPKGYAYATAKPANPTTGKEPTVSSTRVLLGGESAGALHEAKVSSKNTEDATKRIENTVTLVADQLLGWPKDSEGNYLISGWDFDSIVEAAEAKMKDGKGITLVEQVALLQKQNQHLAEALDQATESIGHLIDAFQAQVK